MILKDFCWNINFCFGNVTAMKFSFLLNLIFSFMALSVQAFEIPIALEHAVTPEQLAVGLMGRSSLPENQGMLFTFSPPRQVTMWMLNTQIDLAVAFLDRDQMIFEIQEMKAYPHIKDPQFFMSQSMPSAFTTSYALEMNGGWFEKHGVHVGDRVTWEHNSSSGAIVRP